MSLSLSLSFLPQAPDPLRVASSKKESDRATSVFVALLPWATRPRPTPANPGLPWPSQRQVPVGALYWVAWQAGRFDQQVMGASTMR